MTKFELTENQEIKLNEWQEKIKKRFGEYGSYDYIFTPLGMGTSVIVISHLTKKKLDLSDVDEW